MTKKQKALINNAKPYVLGTPLTEIYIIPSGRKYKGGWGDTGYDHMYLLGKNTDKNSDLYYINKEQEVDALVLFHFAHIHAIDIPSDYSGTIRLVFDAPIAVDELLSSITPHNLEVKL